ncbi:hypothetical protein CWB41_14085 [Methylovirgula ligni]|uniref:Chitinase class I n=1 Tax=Methylovirgula ligni TaxID=569860 RepID=A0A3D9YL10_9HYPH|nr:hypothetical protein [Methylovirgula ligni]QAY97403.1 hypothetical protein CWB41_14085 [Methylovirgula ligni]REF83236.1 chitinase class I [Methylovirgula ligni]
MNEAAFFDAVRVQPFRGALSQSQVDGLNAILAAFDKFQALIKDRRWKAYMLATVFHETAFTMQPVREIGEGRGKPYGEVYYGRGYVQLTWSANYAKAQAELANVGITVSLLNQPDAALIPEIAAPIMILGMINGWFTGKRLSDFFSPVIDDWVGARRIINGEDRAELIAGYGIDFNTALVKAL